MAKKRKKDAPSDADIKQQLDAFPIGMSKAFDALRADQAAHISAFAEYKREAELLFDAVDGVDWMMIDRYVQDHPPSSAAIGFLILVAKDRFKNKASRDGAMARIAAYEPAKKFVIVKWAEREPDEYESKIDFARFFQPAVENLFRVKVTTRTIVGDWLKGR